MSTENAQTLLAMNATNIVPLEWMPQTDLLCRVDASLMSQSVMVPDNTRVVAFITHMGLNSYIELAHAGPKSILPPLIKLSI